MINVTVFKEESYLIPKSDRGIHEHDELDVSRRGAAVRRRMAVALQRGSTERINM